MPREEELLTLLKKFDVNEFVGGEDDSSLESAIARNMRIMANPNRQQIKWYAHLSREMVILLSQFKVRNRFSKDRYTTNFIEDVLDFSVSTDRQGRTELKDIFKNLALPRDMSAMERLGEMIGRKH